MLHSMRKFYILLQQKSAVSTIGQICTTVCWGKILYQVSFVQNILSAPHNWQNFALPG